ncbi:hypothetical protein K438DRAFT_1753586 [Mycena galopus ATCC 62051]|nr:hypothetical protein K438DRAFT_1753586 [Mycena galopus ATCC 62051]
MYIQGKKTFAMRKRGAAHREVGGPAYGSRSKFEDEEVRLPRDLPRGIERLRERGVVKLPGDTPQGINYLAPCEGHGSLREAGHPVTPITSAFDHQVRLLGACRPASGLCKRPWRIFLECLTLNKYLATDVSECESLKKCTAFLSASRSRNARGGGMVTEARRETTETWTWPWSPRLGGKPPRLGRGHFVELSGYPTLPCFLSAGHSTNASVVRSFLFKME